jgi:poly-gamma-glutamate synthesis protein (capsule biosynthesis protein)
MTTVITAVGDLMFYGDLREAMFSAGDPLWGFRSLDKSLLTGDILFGNLETPVSEKHRNEPQALDRYWAPPGIGLALKKFGFDVVNLANNHIYDFGFEGVECTVRELKEAGLPYFGIGATSDAASLATIIEARNGQKFGFLGYTTAHNVLNTAHKYVACFPDLVRVRQQVKELAQQVDAAVVSCHTGAQYNPYPAPETRELARASIEAGASLFLGHHPHVPQGIERIGDGLAVYSLGDFVAPVHGEQSRRTFFARIKLDGSRVKDCEVVPCWITYECQTTVAMCEMAYEITNHIEKLSEAISAGLSDDLHFRTARSRFFSQYVSSWREELRFGGVNLIWRKIRNLRAYHFQLLARLVLGRFLTNKFPR